VSRATPAVLPITGYLDRLSVRPGGRLAVKVSAEGGGHYEAAVVRIRHGDPNPAGPGLKYEPQDFGAGRHPARSQAIDLGSYAVVPAHPAFAQSRLLVSVLVQPWLLRAAPSTLAAAGGWTLAASEDELSFSCAGAEGAVRLALPARLRRRQWYRVWAGYDCERGRLLLACRALDGSLELQNEAAARLAPPRAGDLTFAASLAAGLSRDHFNGRLEDPALFAAWPEAGVVPSPEGPMPGLLAWWDFALSIESQAILDRGPRGLHGRLVNVPTRAVCGARWQGEAMHWRQAPRDYAAIHFHEDDLYDCGWDTDFELEIPAGTKSGLYGLRLTKGSSQDILPFYVLAPKGQPGARVCFLAPSFTYQAYSNYARDNCDATLRQRMADWGAYPHNIDDFALYGRSAYNFHPDRSGHAFSSRLRPVLTSRPGYLTFFDAAGSGLRLFAADTHLLDWLEAKGIDFDVVTDEDLDDEGVALIEGYRTLLTGSHPEYHTVGTLDALAAYTAGGGRLVYLGGNGFYWRVTRSRSLPGMIELRRAETGIRAWAAEPGEGYHQLDGRYGGLWRRNGRPPQRLAGVGFSSQGPFEGAWYRRLPDSERPEVSWIFEGVTEEKLGAYGLSGGGAAGFELDRADPELGTPPGTLILARSEGHSEAFIAVYEEMLALNSTVTGEPARDLVRAEIVWFETPGGGAVFSVGSITFCGSLSHNGYDNGVSRMLENVVRRFMA